MQVFQKHEARARRDRRGDRRPQALLRRLGRLTVHALYDGDRIEPWETVMTIEGDYTLLRPPRDRLPRRARAAHADHDEHRRACSRPRTASRSSSCRPGTTTTACRPGDGYAAYVAGAVVGARDRRHLRRAGVVVGRPRGRHRAARADRRRTAATPCSRRRSSPSGRRPGHQHRRARRLRERLGARPRSRSRARSGRGSGACGSTPRASSSTARSGTRWATSTRAA